MRLQTGPFEFSSYSVTFKKIQTDPVAAGWEALMKGEGPEPHDCSGLRARAEYGPRVAVLEADLW